MKHLFEDDLPEQVEVLESHDKITVKFSMKIKYTVRAEDGTSYITTRSAFDAEDIEILNKKTPNPHKTFRRFALVAIAMHVVFLVYIYLTANLRILAAISVISILPYKHFYERRDKRHEKFERRIHRKRFKAASKLAVSEYNIFIDFDKVKKTVHPSLDKTLFELSGLRPIETEPSLEDCKPFPIDENSIFVYGGNSYSGVRYQYGLRQSKLGFYVSTPVPEGVSEIQYNSHAATFVAVLNEIIAKVRASEDVIPKPKPASVSKDEAPFNPME